MENSSESGSALFENWSKFQKEFFDKWGESAENFQKVFKGVDRTKDVNGNTQDIFSLYQSWKDTFGKYFDVMIKNNPINVNTDTMSKLFSSADVYVKLYEFWEPLIKAFQERAIDPDSYKDLFDPSKYKEMVNKVFGFSSPETMKEFYDQTSKLIETWGSKAQLFVNPWTDAIQKNIDAYHDFSKGDYEAAYNIFHNLYSGFESTSGKAFKMPAVGKDREEIELILKTLDRYSVFLAKSTEFQHKIYLTGQDAMEKVIESIAQKTREKEDITSFNEFIKLWATVNEKAFLELFNTEEFSKLQGTLLDVALDTRKYFHQLMELYLADFPIALRSEMNDVYKTVYHLNKNVRELLKKNNEIEDIHKEISDLKEKMNKMGKKIHVK
jgi:class III poly(R)-hydroxyalkanoic acid synthase PhaE subunit